MNVFPSKIKVSLSFISSSSVLSTSSLYLYYNFLFSLLVLFQIYLGNFCSLHLHLLPLLNVFFKINLALFLYVFFWQIFDVFQWMTLFFSKITVITIEMNINFFISSSIICNLKTHNKIKITCKLYRYLNSKYLSNFSNEQNSSPFLICLNKLFFLLFFFAIQSFITNFR